jgi:hypothetical protein
VKQTRVNIASAVNAASIRRERRAGRDVIIVPSATLPDNVVMNGVRYPADEIAKSFHTLEGTPAPLGHPDIEGAFVSASDPRGMVRGFVGAWNENVRREGGRVRIDKVIDVEYAKQLEGGRAVLEAIDKSDPIHTSTGLYAVMVPAENDADAESVATDMVFDHDAILLGEAGAATPEQGVGMLVNKAVSPTGEQVALINSSLVDDAERGIDWAIMDLARAIDRKQEASVLTRMKTAIMDALGMSAPASEPERETSETKEREMADSEQLTALSAKVDALSEAIGNIVGSVKALTDRQDEIVANQKAAEDAELADLRSKIVKANLLDETAAGELTLNAARALAKKAEPGKAAAINGGFAPAKSEPAGFVLPKAEA